MKKHIALIISAVIFIVLIILILIALVNIFQSTPRPWEFTNQEAAVVKEHIIANLSERWEGRVSVVAAARSPDREAFHDQHAILINVRLHESENLKYELQELAMESTILAFSILQDQTSPMYQINIIYDIYQRWGRSTVLWVSNDGFFGRIVENRDRLSYEEDMRMGDLGQEILQSHRFQNMPDNVRITEISDFLHNSGF
ncbi:MAG: hypothetical protein FWE24_00545 [Defluviitaleaceae bacterium]|nr:hypothetical protein [Defluviitaleaceae bacterium]